MGQKSLTLGVLKKGEAPADKPYFVFYTCVKSEISESEKGPILLTV